MSSRPDNVVDALGKEVRRLRDQRSLTRRELAQRSGLSERFLADLEGGHGNISVAKLQMVALALGSTAGELLYSAQGGPLFEGLTRDELAEAQRWIRARFRQASGPMVALVGLRGAGKSTIGKALSQKLSAPFVELDALVEKDAGLSLNAIFSLHGEAYYRRLAREVMTRFLGEADSAVIATGGGVVTDREAWKLLQKRCTTVWLQATPEDHWKRVLGQGDVRPGAASPHAQEELKALLKAREPLYAQAAFAVDTSKLGVAGTVDEIARYLPLNEGARRAL